MDCSWPSRSRRALLRRRRRIPHDWGARRTTLPTSSGRVRSRSCGPSCADPKDKSRDEALYWLAHSLNQAGDSAAAITTIRRLEREYPTSLWVKPAGSLRVDIAVHLQRSDVLWWMAAAAPAPPAPGRGTARAVGASRGSDSACLGDAARSSRAATAPPPPGHRPPPPPAAPHVAPAFPTPPVPPAAWLPEEYRLTPTSASRRWTG
mgnify:CR=1 FL=1